MEYGEGSYRVHCWYEGPEGKALDEVQLVHHVSQAKKVDTSTNHQSTDSCAQDGKHHDRPNVLEEVTLVEIVARLKYDGGQQHQEEHGGGEGLHPLGLCLWQGHHEHAHHGPQEHDGKWFWEVVELDL